jgi:hypothetical protein
LNEEKLNNQPLINFLSGKHFMSVVYGVKQLSMEADSPNLALTLGHYLKQINLLKMSIGIQSEDPVKSEQLKEAGDFQVVV